MTKKSFGIDSFWLHIIAMAIMLCDHIWGTVMYSNFWFLTFLGRLAFPIFAFMLAEGFFHTGNIGKYFLRLLIGAIISEIPFNLMMSGYWIDPFEQNVMWTFLIALACMHFSSKIRKKNETWGLVAGIGIFAIGALVGFITMVDYSGYGIMMVGVFYFFRGRKWWQILAQIAGLLVINGVIFKGMMMDVSIFGFTFEVKQQAFAVFAMIPILLYNGERGLHNKMIQYSFYLFYPVHILILSLMALYLL